ncbi:MAG: hypothetical protein EOO88_41565, partial [Pedobacter sp.]
MYKELTLLLPYQAEKATKFLNYGMQCYTNNSHTDGCNTYLKPRLPLISTRGQPCPFGDNICKLENDNLMMDTGYLDSLEDLGINTAQKDRFQLRMVYQCAPLKTQGYMRDYNDSDYGAAKRYMYGPVVNVKQTINWTYDDGNGNTSSQVQTVIIDDVTAPVADISTLPDATGECSVTVTAPTAMRDLDPNRLDRIIQSNYRLMGPVPYVGGDIRVEIGLLSVASADLAAPYLQLLETLSDKAGVSYIKM